MSYKRFFRAVAILSALTAISIVAQEEAQQQDDGQLNTIIVTATKSERNLQEVPVAITAIGGEFLQNRLLVDVSDIILQVPGLNMTTGSRSLAQPVIRGGGSDDDSPGVDLGVGLFVDDVFLGRNIDFTFDLFDLKRVEVLRGPQGTLFGRNVTGGVINVITNNPDTGEFSGRAEILAGSFNRFNTNVMFNVPLIEDKLAVRFAASSRSSDGSIENENGPDVEQENLDSFRGKLLYKPNEDVSFLLTTNYMRDKSVGVSRDIVNLSENMLPSLLSQINPDNTVVNLDAVGAYDRTVWGISGKLIFDTEMGEITAITSWHDNQSDYSDIDVDGTPVLILGGPGTNSARQFSQELRHTNMSDDGRFEWIGGLYYLDIDFARVEYVNQIPPPGSFLEAIGLPPIGGSFGPSGAFSQSINTKSYAAFGQITYTPESMPEMRLTLGGRYTKDKKSGFTADTGVIDQFNIDVAGDWGAFTPKFSVDYDFSDEVIGYVSATRGFKSGGFSATTNGAEAAEAFAPEYVWSYEVGVKSRFFDNSLQANIAAFYADYTDLQFRAGTVGTASFVGNAGEAEVAGVEIELDALLNKNIRVFTNYSYQDSEFIELEIGGSDMSGNVLPLTPKNSLTAGFEYSNNVSDDVEMLFTGDFLYKSKAYFDPENYEESVQEVDGIVNVSLSFASLEKSLKLTFFVKNLTDEVYITRANRLGVFLGNVDFSQGPPFAQVVAGTFSSPRTYGVSLLYDF